MTESDSKHVVAPAELPEGGADIDETKRKLLRQLSESSYLAPVALALMSTKASACSLSC
jgi:hypothetical protein